MATLTIRNLDIQVEESLRLRATRHGRSIEAEARAILAESVAPPPRETVDLAEAIRRRFAPLGGVELEPHPPVAIGPRPRFDGGSFSIRTSSPS
ncbi:FitA-like ribbon-helix-helix domain-containing protein [Methylobacterium terrae]|uniref:FitA-like ribbon-helix-helix domain-containing protein n=1 Tax=Methylobacterium terrae TaxID=2202827 RepID=UPI001FE19F90|nr:plasmid stabilization protein [Methylobacterium terrae]